MENLKQTKESGESSRKRLEVARAKAPKVAEMQGQRLPATYDERLKIRGAKRRRNETLDRQKVEAMSSSPFLRSLSDKTSENSPA